MGNDESKEVAVRSEAGPVAVDEASGLIRLALENQMPVEVLERLVALQEHVAARDARADFFAALANFQDEVPAIRKTRTADIATRQGGKYGYTYAPLEEIVRVVRPVLRQHGFSFTWTVEGAEMGVLNVVCVLRHTSGHEERSAFPVPSGTKAAMSEAQKHGAALTYGKRQSLTSVLGLTTADDDTDGADPPTSEPITETQLADLEALMSEVGADRARFVRYLGVDKLEDLEEHRLADAVRALEQKRGQK